MQHLRRCEGKKDGHAGVFEDEASFHVFQEETRVSPSRFVSIGGKLFRWAVMLNACCVGCSVYIAYEESGLTMMLEGPYEPFVLPDVYQLSLRLFSCM